MIQPIWDQSALLLASTSLEVSVLLLLTVVVVWLCRRSSAHLRQRFLLVAVIASLLFPAVAAIRGPGGERGERGAQLRPPAPIVRSLSPLVHSPYSSLGKFPDLPQIQSAEQQKARQAVRPTQDLQSQTAAVPPLPAWARWGLTLWLAGLVPCLFRLWLRWRAAVGLVREAKQLEAPHVIRALIEVSQRLGITPPRAVVSDSATTPMIWGPPRAQLILPTSISSGSPAELRMVLVHELTHLKRRDSLSSLSAELLCAFFWFNPLAWHIAKLLKSEQELVADNEVLSAGVKPSDYSAFLLRLVHRVRQQKGWNRPLGVNAMIGTPLIEHRLNSILETPLRRRPSRQVIAASLAAFLLGAFGLFQLGPGRTLAATGHSIAAAVSSQDQGPLWNQEQLRATLGPTIINNMADRYIAGAAVSIVKDGNLVYQDAFGMRDVFAQDPVHPAQTIFRIGSVSKVITGVAVMQLVDRGLLDLDTDVNQYLVDFKVDDNYDQPVRVKHLLTHTAGFDQIGVGRHVASREEVLPMAEFLADNLVRVRPPGQFSTYDTYAITLAGYLVELISGQSFEQYLLDNIFRPLEMLRSNIVVPERLLSDTAVGYEFLGEWAPQAWEFMNTDPASTVNSTVVDMANFMTMMLQGGQFKGKQILTKQSATQMLTRQQTNHKLLPGFGYTFFEDRGHGLDAFSHGGSMTGFGCSLYLVPEHGLGIFVAYTQESGSLASSTISQLVDTYFAGRQKAPDLLPPLEQQADLARFAGSYADSMHNHTRKHLGGWRARPFDLALNDQGFLEFGGSPLHAVGPLLFQRVDGLLVAFHEDPEGAITHLLVNQTTYERFSDQAGSSEPVDPTAIKLEPVLLDRYTGQYESELGVISFSVVDGGLEATLPDQRKDLFRPYSTTEFFVPSAPARLMFRLDDEGRVIEARVDTGSTIAVLTPLR